MRRNDDVRGMNPDSVGCGATPSLLEGEVYTSASASPRSWRVLIVEDDPVVASVYERTVSAMSRMEVIGTVSSGEHALAMLERRPCDLLLLDLRLAGMSGVTLL